MAPAGRPRPIIDRLNGEINRVVRDPQIVKERMNTVGLEAVGTTPEQLLEAMKSDLAKYTKGGREAEIKPGGARVPASAGRTLHRRLAAGGLGTRLAPHERRGVLQVLLPTQRP